LQGSAFVGTATIRGKTGPCRIEVGGIGSILGKYSLSLTSVPNGRITGSGTLKVGLTAVPVTVTGSVVRGKVSLTVKGGATFLKMKNGAFSGPGFTAQKWSAQGFGALVSGRALPVTPVN
jgi:hypothetical protein